ncbi:MAG: hypothetical protein D8M59_09110 [Planctomycetes bacterium]|nr:hypothetical protein [Planctomycetota bacterium]
MMLLVMAGLLAVTTGCRRTYDQSSAEAVMESARAMVEDGQVAQLPKLIYARTERERAMYDKCGYLLDRMYRLSERIREEFPEEVAELKDEGIEKAQEVAQEQDRRRGNDNVWQEWVAGFLSDPFGMLDKQMARVEVVEVDDLRSAVTVDGMPAFGVGLVIRKGDGDDPNWYFELPTSIPMVNQQMPQTEAEWKIIGAMLKSVANSVSWIEESIDSGEAESLKDVGQEAFEMVAPTLFMQWSLYDRAVKARPKEAENQAEDGDGGDQ